MAEPSPIIGRDAGFDPAAAACEQGPAPERGLSRFAVLCDFLAWSSSTFTAVLAAAAGGGLCLAAPGTAPDDRPAVLAVGLFIFVFGLSAAAAFYAFFRVAASAARVAERAARAVDPGPTMGVCPSTSTSSTPGGSSSLSS